MVFTCCGILQRGVQGGGGGSGLEPNFLPRMVFRNAHVCKEPPKGALYLTLKRGVRVLVVERHPVLSTYWHAKVHFEDHLLVSVFFFCLDLE